MQLEHILRQGIDTDCCGSLLPGRHRLLVSAAETTIFYVPLEDNHSSLYEFSFQN
jgi:hypothetical protein